MILKTRECDEHAQARLNQQSCPPLLSRIFASRGIQSLDDVTGSLKHLAPVSALKNIDQAAKLIAEHMQKGNRILIVGDFDADGATSTAVFIRALHMMGQSQVDYLVPNRFEYGYGLSPELVEEATKFQPNLLITVDNGISSLAGTTAAKQKGWDVLITDHHLPAETLPEADVIVNPNQVGDEFPSKSLAGVGVTFYVVLALKKELQQRGWFETRNQPNLVNLLDLVALGTVADVVSLDRNNRILVEQGLKQIRKQQACPGIQALFQLAGKSLHNAVATDLGFTCGPRLNAAGRLDDMSIGIECLLSNDLDQALSYAQMLDDYNQERKELEGEMKQQAFQQLEQWEQSQTNQLSKLPNILCLYNEHWHQGIIGILAARIKEKYHRPCIIFAKTSDDEQDSTLKASARSINGIHIRDLLAQLDAKYPNIIMKFGGHAMAAGLSLDQSKFDDFQHHLQTIARHYCTEDMLTETAYTDGELEKDELNIGIAEHLRFGGGWGQHFAEAVLEGEFTIKQKQIIKNKNMSLQLSMS